MSSSNVVLSTRKAARFRDFLVATGVPLSKLVRRLATVQEETPRTTRSVMRPLLELPGLLPTREMDEGDESALRTFELANCITLLYFAVGYYLRVDRCNQLMYTLQTNSIALNILPAVTLVRSDRRESLEYLLDAMWTFRRRLIPIYLWHEEHPDVFTLREYLCSMDRQLQVLLDLEGNYP